MTDNNPPAAAPQDVLHLAAAYRKAASDPDPAAGNAALTALARALDADALGRARVRLAAAATEDASHDTLFKTWNDLDHNERRAILVEPVPAEVPTVRWSAAVRDDPEPTPILWRDNPDSHYIDDPVVSAGECAVLAGAGAGGKSWLAIRLAVEAARAAKAGKPSAAACGLCVRAGPVIVASYEMSPKRIDLAAEAMSAPDGVPCLPYPPPLFPMDPATRTHAESPYWRAVWDALAREQPALIVFDTGPKAMGGADLNSAAPVIAFLQAIERELKAIGECAALVICHDTKPVRDAARAGEDVGAGGVAGSGQWYDSPRGVLHLSKVAGAETRILECIKASNGHEHWGAVLAPYWRTPANTQQSRYAGLQLDNSATDGGRIEPGGMSAVRKAAKTDTVATDRSQPLGANNGKKIQPGKVAR